MSSDETLRCDYEHATYLNTCLLYGTDLDGKENGRLQWRSDVIVTSGTCAAPDRPSPRVGVSRSTPEFQTTLAHSKMDRTLVK